MGPAGLAATLSNAALTGATLTTAATASKAITMTTLQKTVITTVLAAAVGIGIYEARQASNLRTQVQALQQQRTPLAERIQHLQHERDEATSGMARLTERLYEESGGVGTRVN